MNREKVLTLLRRYLKTENTIKHLLATEAIMRALAKKFAPGEEEEWALAGLVHDLDYEVIKDETEHGRLTIALLEKEGLAVSERVKQAVLAHCAGIHPEWTPPEEDKMGWSLFIVDSLTGLIVATALVRPDKKLASVEVGSVLKKFKQPSFAAGTRREDILQCREKLGLSPEELVEISLQALQKISPALGL